MRRVGIERGHGPRVPQQVFVGRAVELHGLVDNSCAWRLRRVYQQVSIRKRAVCSARPSSAASFLSGRIAMRFPPPWTQFVSIVTCAVVSV